MNAPTPVPSSAAPDSTIRDAGMEDFISVRRNGAFVTALMRRKPALVLLLVIVGVSLAQASGVVLSAHGRSPPLILVLWGQVTGAVGAWCALPAIVLAVANAPSPAVGWRRFVLTHIGGYVAFTALHLAAMFAFRWSLRTSSGIDQVPRDALAFIAFDAQKDVLVYSAIAGVIALLYGWQERRAAAVRAAQLAAKLAEARLDSLTARLDPHFLFNGLNTVSALMYEDLPRTERLLAGLGEMLRDTLRASGPFWSLAREWAHTQRYLELVAARFEERLIVHCEAPNDLARFRVPRFVIQTLVENAVKHNADRLQPLHVSVRVATAGSALRILVEDDGRGFGDSDTGRAGDGSLARLREILQLTYGENARLECGNLQSGGARVDLALENAEAPREDRRSD